MSFGKQPRQYRSPNEKYRCAGTMDFKGYVHKLNGIYIIDFKTAKDDYPEYRMQTAKYRAMDGEATGNAVLILNKETGYPKFFDHSDTYKQDLDAFNLLLDFWYNRNGEKIKKGHVVSVTQVLSLLDKSGPLMWWAVNCYRDYMLDALEQLPSTLVDLSSIYSLVEKGRKNFRTVSQKALDIGSAVHAAIEQYLRTGIEPKIEDDAILAGFLAFLEFQDEYGIEPLEVEKVLYG